MKANQVDKSAILAAISELKKSKDQLLKMEERSRLKPRIPQKDGKIEFSQDFFACQTFFVVSCQLQVEIYACARSNVYTFGPTFCAKNYHTSRNLEKFWMVEPEIAFADIQVRPVSTPLNLCIYCVRYFLSQSNIYFQWKFAYSFYKTGGN